MFVTSAADLRQAQAATRQVRVAPTIHDLIADLAAYTREHALIGASTRGAVALYHAAQARAIVEGRDFVIPDDVQQEAPAVLAHRLVIDARSNDREPRRSLVTNALEAVPVK